MATLYFIDDYDNSWDSADNWFTQVVPTQIPAGRIPTTGDDVTLYATVAAGPSTPVSLASLTLHSAGQMYPGTSANITTASLVITADIWPSTWEGTASTTAITGSMEVTVSGSLGNNVTIGNSCQIIGADGTIGSGCSIGIACSLSGTMTLGTGCSCGSSAPYGWVFGNAYAQTAGDFEAVAGTSSFTGVTAKGGQTGNLVADSTTSLTSENAGFTVAGNAALNGTSLEVYPSTSVQVTGVTTFAAGSYSCASGGSFISGGAVINSGGVGLTIGEGCGITLGATKVHGALSVNRQGSGYLSAAITLNHPSASVSFEGNVGIDLSNLVIPAVGKVLAGQTYGLNGIDQVGTLSLPGESDVRSGVAYGEGKTGSMLNSGAAARGLWF